LTVCFWLILESSICLLSRRSFCLLDISEKLFE
jgi:hypothetical protein